MLPYRIAGEELYNKLIRFLKYATDGFVDARFKDILKVEFHDDDGDRIYFDIWIESEVVKIRKNNLIDYFTANFGDSPFRFEYDDYDNYMVIEFNVEDHIAENEYDEFTELNYKRKEEGKPALWPTEYGIHIDDMTHSKGVFGQTFGMDDEDFELWRKLQ